VTLSRDLLKQAASLAKREPKHPTQASLRRAVSTAYYAMFHLMGEAVAARFSPSSMHDFVRRGLDHGRMRQAADHVKNLSVNRATQAKFSMAGVAVSQDLATVATAIGTLQHARHEADYNLAHRYTRAEVDDLIRTANAAFAAWGRIATVAEADAFIVALLFWNDRR
jgi:hypothetical protein